MTKKEIENKILSTYCGIFDRYPDLNYLPIYAWGRLYKYECAGNPFEVNNIDRTFSEIYYGITHHIDFKDNEYELLEKIDNELFKHFEAFSPKRKDCVRIWDFDERGGKCIGLFREDDKLVVKVNTCESPE